MPGGELHAAITKKALGITGEDIQRLMDSTANAHGPHHREDAVHSIPGITLALAQEGKLTPKNLAVAHLHLGTDLVMSEVYRRVLPKGPLRRPAQQLFEAAAVKALRPKRRR
jgi:hypothetical protein